MMASVEFLLNERIERAEADAGLPLLDYLRDRRRLVGIKEGCHEGDCGACAVLLGRLGPDGWRYKSVTGCLLPLADVVGAHVVTIEGLNRGDGALTAVQRAIVDGYGSQCGYCTPGIVVSLTEVVLSADRVPDRDDIRRALGGHLCRCTGYGGLLRAGDRLIDMLSTLDLPADMPALVDINMLPAWFADIDELRAPLEERPPAAGDHGLAFAGGTDIYTRGPAGASSGGAFRRLADDARLFGIQESGDTLRIGAMTTTRELMDSAQMAKLMPSIATDLLPVAAQTIRNRSTLGGNIVTGAHNADLATIMLGLDATLSIVAGSSERRVALADFYGADGRLDLAADEVVAAVHLPLVADRQVNFERVSKRSHHDKAIVNTLMSCRPVDGRLAGVRLAAAGVACHPLRLRRAEDWLEGRPVDTDTVAGTLERVAIGLAPVDDYQGSARYKRLLLRQLVLAHFAELFGDDIDLEALTMAVAS